MISLTTTTTKISLSHGTLTDDLLIHSLAQQTRAAMRTLAQHHKQKILHEKEKLSSHFRTTENPISLYAIMNAIGTRQDNMIQRSKYNVEQQIKAFSQNKW